MIRWLLAALAAFDSRQLVTVYCQACAQHMPIGHGCQTGNTRP